MKRFLLAVVLGVLLFLVPGLAFGQGTIRTMPPVCLAAGLTDGTCVPERQGTRARITDGDDTNNDCTGGGSTARTCEYNGSAWVPVTSGTFVGANGESIVNTTDGEFLFTRDEAGTVTLMPFDGSNPTDLIIDSGTSGSITIGTADTANISLVNTSLLSLGASTTNSTLMSTDSTLLGIDFYAARTVTVVNAATGTIDLDFRDYADTDDDDMAHSIITVNCPVTGTGAEACDMDFGIVTGGAAAATIIHLDGDEGDDGSENSVTFGNANTEVITLTTDSTGDGEVVLPNDSIGSAEILGTSVCGAFFWAQGDPTEAGATPDFLSFWDHGMSTTEGNEDLMQANAVLLNFHSMSCVVDVAPGAGDDWLVSLREAGGAPTSGTVTCRIDDTNTSCASADTATVAVGALINLDVESDTGATDPTAAALLTCTICAGH